MQERETWGEIKTIEQLTSEFSTFADQSLTVMGLDDGGETLRPVRLVGKEFIGNLPCCALFIEKAE